MLMTSKSVKGFKSNSCEIISDVTLTIALDEALLLDSPDAIGNSDSVLNSTPNSFLSIP